MPLNAAVMRLETMDTQTPRRLSEKEAAKYLGPVAVRTLQDWRGKGSGPAFVKLGKRVAYAVADLDAYLAAQRVEPKAMP